MFTIDGSQGEGGGQILRTTLALSMCLQKPIKIYRIRAARKKPGLQPQHLAAVRAAAQISHAYVAGAELGSQTISFIPQHVEGGTYHFSIGTAGSTTLLFQTLLPALMCASQPSDVVLEGGTHNPMAPTFEFLKYAYLPLINQMGPVVTARLIRPGYYPAGGGEVRITIQPVKQLRPLSLLQRGNLVEPRAEVLLSHLPTHIAERELKVIADTLHIPGLNSNLISDDTALGPGNSIAIIIQCEIITEVFTALGTRGLPAEKVARHAVQAARNYLDSEVPVGHYLADQLLLPMALTGSGKFITGPPSLHTTTNLTILNQFTQKPFIVDDLTVNSCCIQLS